MKTFLSQEALVVAYWRKLASSIRTARKSSGRISAPRATALRTQARRVAHGLQTRPALKNIAGGDTESFRHWNLSAY